MSNIACKDCGTTVSDMFIHTSVGSFCEKCWKEQCAKEKIREINETYR